MPVASIESLDFDIRHQQGILVDGFAFEPQPERLAYHAVAAIASGQEIRTHYFTGP
jgi:hypothetical protein